MYVPEDYKNYKYIVDYSDNYVVLTNRSSVTADWNSPVTIPVVIQYFKPSSLTILDNRNVSQSRQFTMTEVSSDFDSRADVCELYTAIFCVGLFILFLINGLTRLVFKGGIFFGK